MLDRPGLGHLEPSTEPSQRRTCVDGVDALPLEKVPSPKREPRSVLPAALPHTGSVAVATERGDLAALHLECYMPTSHAPVLGRYCLISAPPVLLWSQVWGRHGETGVLLREQDALLNVGTKAVPGERETPKTWPAGLGLPPVASPWASFDRAGAWVSRMPGFQLEPPCCPRKVRIWGSGKEGSSSLSPTEESEEELVIFENESHTCDLEIEERGDHPFPIHGASHGPWED